MGTSFEREHSPDNLSIKALFDVIILTGNVSTSAAFLDGWRHVIEGVHCIIVQQGDPARTVSGMSCFELVIPYRK
jgi:hypothetical protein